MRILCFFATALFAFSALGANTYYEIRTVSKVEVDKTPGLENIQVALTGIDAKVSSEGPASAVIIGSTIELTLNLNDPGQKACFELATSQRASQGVFKYIEKSQFVNCSVELLKPEE